MYLLVSPLLVVLALSPLLPAMAAAATYEPYPAMPAGHTTGSLTGRVTNTNGTGIQGANVTIVNASNLSLFYTGGKTDSEGNFGFSGINSSGGQEAYRVYANASGYSDAYSVPVRIEPGNTCNVHTLILGGSGPSPTPTPSPTPKPGNVSGYVTLAGYGGAITDARVCLVDALDAFTVYNATYTNTSGYYRFEGVRIIGAPGYRVHVEKDGYVEAYSAPFNVNQGASVSVNMTVNKIPEPTATATSGNNPSGRVNTTTDATIISSATPASPANAGIPGLPGFAAITAVAGVVIAYAAVRKQ